MDLFASALGNMQSIFFSQATQSSVGNLDFDLQFGLTPSQPIVNHFESSVNAKSFLTSCRKFHSNPSPHTMENLICKNGNSLFPEKSFMCAVDSTRKLSAIQNTVEYWRNKSTRLQIKTRTNDILVGIMENITSVNGVSVATTLTHFVCDKSGNLLSKY